MCSGSAANTGRGLVSGVFCVVKSAFSLRSALARLILAPVQVRGAGRPARFSLAKGSIEDCNSAVGSHRGGLYRI